MSRRRIVTLAAALVAVASSLAVACGGAPPPPPAAPAVEAPKAPPVPEGPTDPSPNVKRDRRAKPGVRAPAKRLVLGGKGRPRCGKLGRVKLGAKSADLLGGRLALKVPAESKPVPPAPGAPFEQEESRVVVERGGEGLAIVARELFQLDPDLYAGGPDVPVQPGTLDVEAAKFLKATIPGGKDLVVTPVALEGGKLRAYAARPRTLLAKPGSDTAFVLGLLIAQPEGALERITFHVRADRVRDATGNALAGCTRLAERIAATIVSGSRKLERAAGARELVALPGGSALTVRVPADYVAVSGGEAARIYKLRPLSLYPGNIAIAVTPKGESHALDGEEVAKAKLLGQDVSWRGKASPKGGYLFASTPLGATHGDALVEVLVKATRQREVLDQFRAVAETLAVTPGK